MRSRKASRRWASALLSVLMTMALIPVGTTGEKVYAKPTEKTVAGLCTSAIRSPSVPNTEDDAWMGDYVWYGKYDGNPVRYRVLAPSTTKYGSSTMFLDCENTLFLAPLDTEDKTAEEPIPWAQCDLRAELNGSGFLTKSNGFTDRERDAIASSKIASHALVAGYGPGNVYEGVAEMVKTNTALTGEKIFILDVEEISNSDYGYLANVGHTECRLKYDEHGGPHQWWLRSVSNLDTPLVHFIIGSSSGDLSDNGVIAGVSTPSGGYPGGVSPAFNVKRSDILFITAVKEYSSHPVTEYKLTLKDPKMEIRQYPGQSAYNAGGDWIAIPYLVSGENRTLANRMSVLILDKPYTAANTNDAQVLYYKKMDTISNNDFSSGSTASFRFPTELDRSKWGKSYYVYMVLEQENGVYETDYASEPLKIEAPGDPVINFQPKDTSEAVGNKAYFHIVATGDSLSYQWQSRKNSSAAWTNSGQKGAKTNQLEVETLAGLNGWQFRCIIKDANGKQLASKAAILTVLPKITYKSYWGWTYTGWTHE